MNWSSPFIIYRIDENGKLYEVFKAQDLKKAKYWLTYIAQPGDVMCKTPSHPKHSGSVNTPEYWSHKEQSGKLLTDENSWKKNIATKLGNPAVNFPETENDVLNS